MFRQAESIEDYKVLTQDLKRQNTCLKSENRLLKVKVRKLQEEVQKKEKILHQNLLDPNKTRNVRKLLSENGAAIVLHLKRQNEQLEKCLFEREAEIKRLQNCINNIKAYQSPSTFDKLRLNVNGKPQSPDRPSAERPCKNDLDSPKNVFIHSDGSKKVTVQIENSLKKTESDSEHNENSSDNDDLDDFDGAVLNWAQEILNQNLEQIKCQYINNDVRARYESLTRDHLVSIIENLKLNIRNVTNYCSKLSSRIHDVERLKMKKLKAKKDSKETDSNISSANNLTLIVELEQMKGIVNQLQEDKRAKDENIKKLAEEIASLKIVRNSKEISPSGDLKTSKLSSPSHYRCSAEKPYHADNTCYNKTSFRLETDSFLDKILHQSAISPEDITAYSAKAFALTQSKKQNHKAQISKALKLLRDQKKHPEKYEILLGDVLLNVTRDDNNDEIDDDDNDDDDNDVFTAPNSSSADSIEFRVIKQNKNWQ